MDPIIENDHQVADEEFLASLEGKLRIVRDRTRGVAGGYATGLYLWGEGGTSKSYTVEQTLAALKANYKLSNSRLTGKGLFELLRDHPDVVHVLDDAETLFADKNSHGVLRSALWGRAGAGGKQERLVVWHVGGRREEVLFTGGIVLIANAPLDDLPQLRALKTRIPCVHYQPTNAELAAMMREMARRGHRLGEHFLGPEACLEVAGLIIDRDRGLGRNLDLRLFVGACNDRLQYEHGAAETDWADLLESRLRERAIESAPPRESRAERKSRELALAESIADLPRAERLAAWARETGKSQAAMYRLLAELT